MAAPHHDDQKNNVSAGAKNPRSSGGVGGGAPHGDRTSDDSIRGKQFKK